MFYCFFEQSGTFKNEFIKLGYKAVDVDIEDSFNQVDYQLNLFEEIDLAYYNIRDNIFNIIDKDHDTIIAFFPCIRFSRNALMHFNGSVNDNRNSLKDKLEYCLKLHDELNLYYSMITKLVLICLNKGIKLVIENPYAESHYLIRYWALRPTFIDFNRMLRGDYFVKPTMYYFINCEPKCNFIMEPMNIKKKKTINNTSKGIQRSLISSDYANRFIREFLIDSVDN